MKDKSPFGLNEWLHFLKSKHFPVKANVLIRLKVQVTRSEDTLENMQANIASDPFLAFAILNEANRIVPNKDSQIKTPFHAATMIGMSGIAKLLPQFSPYEDKKQKAPHVQALLGAMQTSYEAASISRSWAIGKLTSHEDDIFWTTLFRDTARWLLWFYAYPTMVALQHSIKQGEKASQAELNHLGCRIDELTAHLCAHWGTPQKIIDSFLKKHIPNAKEMQILAHLAHHPDELPGFTEDKRLTLLINNPLVFSYCASKVAHEASLMRWDSRNLPFYYRVVATVMHKKIGEVIQIAHLACVESAKKYRISNTPCLANRLIDTDLYTQKAAIGTSHLGKKTIALSPIAHLKKALKEPPKLDSKNKAQLCLKTIKLAIPNALHVIIFMFSSSKQKIFPVYQYGYSIEIIKSINWNTPTGVFKALTQKRSANHLFGQKLNRILPELPKKSNQIIDTASHLMLVSTKTSANDTLIFWLETRTEFNEADFNNLKKIASLISDNTL